MNRQKMWNAPNIITLTRIALVPVFIWAALYYDFMYSWLPVVLFAAAALTDGVDGYIARKYKLVTTFGKFIDPLADKLLVTAALLVLLERWVVPVWAVMTILAREFTVTSLRMVAADSGVVVAAGLPGKIKTVIQTACIVFMLLPPFYDFVYSPDYLESFLHFSAVWLMVAVTVWSGIDYIWKYRKLLAAPE